jgi:hypothetical protein
VRVSVSTRSEDCGCSTRPLIRPELNFGVTLPFDYWYPQ